MTPAADTCRQPGGNDGGNLGRRDTDQGFAAARAVARTLDDKLLGRLLGPTMQIAVSIGGLPYFATSYRWGYGEDFRGTEALPAHAEDEHSLYT